MLPGCITASVRKWPRSVQVAAALGSELGELIAQSHNFCSCSLNTRSNVNKSVTFMVVVKR